MFKARLEALHEARFRQERHINYTHPDVTLYASSELIEAETVTQARNREMPRSFSPATEERDS